MQRVQHFEILPIYELNREYAPKNLYENFR